MIVIESINHIGITVSNLEESVKFYKDLFDFDTIDKASGPGLAFMRVADITIGLYESQGYKNSDNSKSRISFYTRAVCNYLNLSNDSALSDYYSANTFIFIYVLGKIGRAVLFLL